MTKNKIGRYLRARASTTELRTSSAARFEAPERRSYGGGECELRADGKERRRGRGSGFYRRADGAAYKEGERGTRALALRERRPRWLAVWGCAIDGQRKERGIGEEGKWREAVLTGGTRGVVRAKRVRRCGHGVADVWAGARASVGAR